MVGLDIEKRVRRPHPPRRHGDAAPAHRPEGHVRPGVPRHGAAPPVGEGFTIPVAQHAHRRRPRRDPRRAGRADPRLPHAAGQRRRRRPARPRQRPGRGLRALRADVPRPARASTGRSRASASRCGAWSARWPASTARWPSKPRDLSELVDSAATTFAAFASEDDNLRATVVRAAPTLRQATSTLRRRAAVRARARARPRARSCPRSRRSTTPTTEVRPFAREAAPIVRTADPAVRPRGAPARARPGPGGARTLARASRSSTARARAQPLLQHARLTTRTARGAADKAGREEGYLFWLAWVAHQRRQPAEHRGRQRPDAPDLPDRHLRRRSPSLVNDMPAARVRAGPLAAAGDACASNPDDELDQHRPRAAGAGRHATEGGGR